MDWTDLWSGLYPTHQQRIERWTAACAEAIEAGDDIGIERAANALIALAQPRGFLLKAKMLAEQGRYDEAIAVLSRGRAVAPSDHSLRLLDCELRVRALR